MLKIRTEPSRSSPWLGKSLTACIKFHPAFDDFQHSSPDVFNKIIHPYDYNAFKQLLSLYNLTSAYPNLVNNLRSGFSLGDFPEILRTHIHKEPKFNLESSEVISTYIQKELSANHMSGPFSCLDIERILHGPFICSPFTVAHQPQGLSLLDKLHVCQNLSKASLTLPSVNSFIYKDEFPICIDTAFWMAEIVGILFFFLSFFFPRHQDRFLILWVDSQLPCHSYMPLSSLLTLWIDSWLLSHPYMPLSTFLTLWVDSWPLG